MKNDYVEDHIDTLQKARKIIAIEDEVEKEVEIEGVNEVVSEVETLVEMESRLEARMNEIEKHINCAGTT